MYYETDMICMYIYICTYNDSLSPTFFKAWLLFVCEDGAVILEKDIEASEVIDDFSRAILLGTTQARKSDFFYQGVSCWLVGDWFFFGPFGRCLGRWMFGWGEGLFENQQLDVPQETGQQKSTLKGKNFSNLLNRFFFTRLIKVKGRCALQFFLSSRRVNGSEYKSVSKNLQPHHWPLISTIHESIFFLFARGAGRSPSSCLKSNILTATFDKVATRCPAEIRFKAKG